MPQPSAKPRTRRTVVVALALLAATVTALPVAQAAPAAGAPEADFNSDGYADLAVAAPAATVDGARGAGYVAVLYGSADGWQTSGRQVISQNTAGVPGGAEPDDAFGAALATADLDGDGYTDLVAGAAGEDTGLVEVVWGGPRGLSGGAVLSTGTSDAALDPEHLAAGDFDGDGAQDVVTVQSTHDLRVLSGPFTRDGGTAREPQVVRDEEDSRVLDLAAGDVDGDGVTDLAATEHDGDEYDARRVLYWHGTGDGLAAATVVQGGDGGRLEGGESLDIGDVNADGHADIVVGRPVDGYDSDLVTPLAEGGRVAFVPGTAAGPDGAAATFLNQDSAGVPGAAEKSDRFGTGVRIGDVDGDGYPDVVTGLPGEDYDGLTDAGSVAVLHGTAGAGGLTGAGAETFSQDTAGVPGAAETADAFGAALHLGDADGDGRADLAVGAPGENADSGSVWTFRSGEGGAGGGAATFGAGTLGTVPDAAGLGGAFAR